MLSFRPMTTTDLPRITELEQGAGPHPWSRINFQDCLRSGYCCRVIQQQKTIIGHGILMFVDDEAHLLILSIDRDCQGQGLGKMLLSHLIDEARRHNATTLFLEVRDSNKRAFQLYLNQGFNEIGRRRNYYPGKNGREDAIVMALDLDTAQL